MIGDAPKDLESTHNVGVRFYPVVPGQEDGSWQRLVEEIYPALLEGRYTREREEALISEFNAGLPDKPTWPGA